MSEYDDIIDLPRPKSKHEPMPMSDRAAQFSPFAALTGYGDAIDETARLTDHRIELSEEQRAELDYKQQYLATLDAPTVTVTYFVPDERKTGGAYVTHTGTLKRIDELERMMVFADGARVSLDEVIAIESDSQ
ncbi:MAG: hypothetical protein U0M31_06125 [Oscillospiraceae bacterium]|nr:hypothetical protein [Oscillospiraceae bacterium]